VSDDSVYVEAAGRLHFGVLDLRGSAGRWFGGLGAAAPAPTLVLSASVANALSVEGEDAARADRFARAFFAHHGLAPRAHIRVHRALPPHAGLGSGTQLALSVARALAELYDLPSDTAALSRAVGRARRSAVGTWTFADGGLVVEGGRRPDRDECGPLLARIFFPEQWRCVVAVPAGAPGISGEAEAAALGALPPPPEHEVQRVAHLVLMALLPAVADDDLAAFGAALTEIQQVTGRWFAPAQGGTFAAGASAALIRKMAAWGVPGVGQSSWGPAVYGVVGSAAAGADLVTRLRAELGDDGTVYEGPFQRGGAHVWRGHAQGILALP
jgi:beta-RFAP synthase